jgi:DNA-binding NarL/FixJ family response regulator
MGRVRVLLADDHSILLDALTKLLEPHFDIVGAVSDGRTLVAKVDSVRPDVVVLDISMPLLNGLDAAQQIKKLHPEVKLIFLTQNQESNLAVEAFRRKASGYIPKISAATELITAISEVMKGNTYVSPLIAEALISSIGDRSHVEKEAELTPREREVLQLLAEGKSMKEIGAILNISTRTVEFHKRQIMDTLRVKTNADLIRYAIRKGLIE